MANEPHQKADLPDASSTRAAITTPSQIGKPSGATGCAIARFSPEGRVMALF